MRELRIAHEIFVHNLNEKDHLTDPDMDGKIIIKLYL
jgi:hypothetical protein